MACFSPLQGYYSKEKNKSGKRSLVFNPENALLGGRFESTRVKVPCGQCVGCRLERSRQWAVRCVHEAQMHEYNCFITLTFNDKYAPKDGSLDVSYFQRFMKRLRKKYGNGIRYFHCGEYGEMYGRPHFHACLFGHDFVDRTLWKRGPSGESLYRSESLEALWTCPKSGESYGYSSIGEVTFESAAYVARYIMKKVTGKDAFFHYADIDYDTGEVLNERKPEYVTMSRGGRGSDGKNLGGIGKSWYDLFKSDVFLSDEVVMLRKGGAYAMRPPKYYDSLYELEYPDDFAKLKKSRVKAASRFEDNNSPERLMVRERCKLAQISSLKRTL